jgi:hypothetical protein
VPQESEAESNTRDREFDSILYISVNGGNVTYFEYVHITKEKFPENTFQGYKQP